MQKTHTHTHLLGRVKLAVFCDHCLSFVSVFRGAGNSEVGVHGGCEHFGDTLVNEVAKEEL